MHTDRVAKAKAKGEARVAAESCQGLYMLSTDIILNAFVPFGSGHGLPILWTNPCQPLRISFVSVFFLSFRSWEVRNCFEDGNFNT